MKKSKFDLQNMIYFGMSLNTKYNYQWLHKKPWNSRIQVPSRKQFFRKKTTKNFICTKTDDLTLLLHTYHIERVGIGEEILGRRCDQARRWVDKESAWCWLISDNGVGHCVVRRLKIRSFKWLDICLPFPI